MTASRTFTYPVPTRVLIDQGRLMLDQLRAPANQPGLEALPLFGLDPEQFIPKLEKAVNDAAGVESDQERAKVDYTREAREDREWALRGYRWVHRLQSRVRVFLAGNPNADADGLRNSFRFGHVKNSRARRVVYEMRILIPEANEWLERLGNVGLTAEFIQEGEEILAALGSDRAETAKAKAKREAMTQSVRKAEQELSALLKQLDTADEAAAMERPESRRWFTLDIIATEQGRTAAARRSAANPVPNGAPDTDYDE